MSSRTVCHLTVLAKRSERALRQELTRAIAQARGNLTEAARLLGVNLSTLRRYVRQLGLEPVVDAHRGDGGAARQLGRAAGVRGGRPATI